MNETKKTQVYNLVILDKSGSMSSIRKSAVDGYNETLGSIRAAQKKHLDTQEHYVSLAAFCGCGITMLYDKTPINEANNMSMADYVPCCATPLFDAIGSTVQKLKVAIKDVEDAAVLVTIITDGYENASKEWSRQAVKKLIEECKADGWMISFIGAGEDVMQTAYTLSITNTVVWEKTEQGTMQMFDDENCARERFFDRMACCCDQSMAPDERRQARQSLSQRFYQKDEDEEK